MRAASALTAAAAWLARSWQAEPLGGSLPLASPASSPSQWRVAVVRLKVNRRNEAHQPLNLGRKP